MPECSLIPNVPLLCVTSIFNFLIILICLHLPSYISVHALSYSVTIINQFIINLSAGAQNITGANVIMLVNNVFTWKSSCVIVNNA